MKKYTINVTQDDIDKGRPMEPESCPIALAIKRELHPESVYVNAADVLLHIVEKPKWFFQKKTKRTLIRPLPNKVGAFVINFDAYHHEWLKPQHQMVLLTSTLLSGTIKPFSFELEI